MSKNHKNFINKIASGSDRDKKGPTRTRKSHENIRRNRREKPGARDITSFRRFLKSLKKFFKNIGRSKSLIAVEEKAEEKKVKIVGNKVLKTKDAERATTRVHQRKGLK